PSDSKKSVVLPSAEVQEGDYVVIYWTEELPSSAVSTDSVLYLCSGTETSLSDDNGILTLSSSPVQGSAVLDCVIYCSFESTQYEGFGTKAVLNRVNKALENAWWYSNAVDSSKSTSTRSICRKLNSTDTDTASDWYTVTTRGLSFGSANTSEAYSP
nr:hypothetical protein [Sphaerochaetaceae bacterium]